jgi:hypothetical protein
VVSLEVGLIAMLQVSLCSFTCVSSLRIWIPVPPPLFRTGSAFHTLLPSLLLMSDYSSKFILFSFAGVRVQYAQRLCWIIFPGDGWESFVLGTMVTFLFCSFMQASLQLAVFFNVEYNR